MAIARSEQSSLSQLYLVSSPGMGKTHLSLAAAAEATQNGEREVRYLSAERFTNQFLAALRSNRTEDFKRRYRGRNQLLIVEDIQFLQSKSATQLEFFHTVQHVLGARGKVVLTGDRLPHELKQMGARLRSQISGGFVAQMEPPDAQVRRAILRSKAADGGVKLPANCLNYLVDSVCGSVRDLEGSLIQLVTTASLLKRPIDLELTRSSVAQKVGIPGQERRLSISDVLGVVAGSFQTTTSRLGSRSRKREILLPRQLAMYLCQRYTDAAVHEIGAALSRDHTAVRNAVSKIERSILERAPLRYQVEALTSKLDQLAHNPQDRSAL